MIQAKALFTDQVLTIGKGSLIQTASTVVTANTAKKPDIKDIPTPAAEQSLLR